MSLKMCKKSIENIFSTTYRSHCGSILTPNVRLAIRYLRLGMLNIAEQDDLFEAL